MDEEDETRSENSSLNHTSIALEEERLQYVMSEKVIGDIKEFLRIMLGTIIRFYSPVIRFEELNEMKEDLIETTTSLIVNGKVYLIVFSFCQLETLDKQKRLVAKYKEFLHIKPEELGIDRFFTLNSNSSIRDVREELIEKRKKQARKILVSINETNESEEYTKSLESPERRSTQSTQVVPSEPLEIQEEVPSEESIEGRLRSTPYRQVTLELRNIKNQQNPIKKLRVIHNLSESIKRSIDNFWEGLEVNESQLTIDADQLLSIFIYVAARAKVVDIFAHIKFISEFTTSYVKNINLGYYLSTLEIALSHLVEMNKRQLMLVLGDRGRRQSIVDEARASFAQNSMRMSFLDQGDPFVEFSVTDTMLVN